MLDVFPLMNLVGTMAASFVVMEHCNLCWGLCSQITLLSVRVCVCVCVCVCMCVSDLKNPAGYYLFRTDYQLQSWAVKCHRLRREVSGLWESNTLLVWWFFMWFVDIKKYWPLVMSFESYTKLNTLLKWGKLVIKVTDGEWNYVFMYKRFSWITGHISDRFQEEKRGATELLLVSFF